MTLERQILNNRPFRALNSKTLFLKDNLAVSLKGSAFFPYRFVRNFNGLISLQSCDGFG